MKGSREQTLRILQIAFTKDELQKLQADEGFTVAMETCSHSVASVEELIRQGAALLAEQEGRKSKFPDCKHD